jgi:large subunit ribosomal protein L25
MLELNVQKRDKKVNLEKLRKEGFLPAVFYGKKEDSTPIKISQADFLKAFREAGESTVITLKHEGGSLDTLIQDVDFDPVTGIPRHADFYAFEKGHKLEVDVPLEFTGIAPGVKELGGLLVKVLHELKIEALPTNLPHQIEVDISSLSEIGSQILAKDIKLPEGVTLLDDEDEVVVLVAAPKEEEEEAAPVDLSAIEVEKKGKEKAPEESTESESSDSE